MKNRFGQRLILSILLGMVALFAHAAPYYASKDGSMVWDEATHLFWVRCSLGQKWNGKTCAGEASKHTPEGAQEAAKQLNTSGGLGGFTDWVVPKIMQLSTLRECSTGFNRNTEDLLDDMASACDVRSTKPTINVDLFPNTPSVHHTSSTPFAGYSGSAWGINFDNGNVYAGRSDSRFAVRVVRASKLLSGEATSVFPAEVQGVYERMAQAQRDINAQEAARIAERAAAQRADETKKTAALKKLVSSGAQALYLQAGKAQRSGSVTFNGVNFGATELYELIVDKFPSSDYAVKASDQLTAMGRTEQQTSATREAAQAQRDADNNASNRASCFSAVSSCEASCRSNNSKNYSGAQYCVKGCQRSCN